MRSESSLRGRISDTRYRARDAVTFRAQSGSSRICSRTETRSWERSGPGDLATVIGLPPPNDLMQLNRPLLTPMLASAFSIPLPDYGGSDGGSFGGQMVQGRMDGFAGHAPHAAGPPAYGYPASYQQHEEEAKRGPPHMDAGKGPMAAGMPAYPGHQPGMMGYDPRGDPNMMGMPPHMQ
eukprot:jgi/Tetstr1/466519/TSEL_011026.t1